VGLEDILYQMIGTKDFTSFGIFHHPVDKPSDMNLEDRNCINQRHLVEAGISNWKIRGCPEEPVWS
jgi:hypothetical protein